MRIGNITDNQQKDTTSSVISTTNYSKADIKKQVKLDITGLGKDTDFCVDQGRSVQDVKDAAGALDVQTARKYMTVMTNTMSEEDYAKMKEDGFDPAKLDEKQTTTILDHIKATMAESGQIVAGYNDNLDLDELIAITGNTGDANALYSAMKQADINISTENAENISQVCERMSDVKELNDNAKKYMIESKLQPTADNLYRAIYSAGNSEVSSKGYYALDMSGYLGKKADVTGEELLGDITAAIDRFGIEDIDKTQQIDAAKWLVEKDINVTESNIRSYIELSNIEFPINREEIYKEAALAIKEGREAKEAVLTKNYEDVYTKAATVLKNTKVITNEAVDMVLSKGQELNLRNLWSANKQVSFGQKDVSGEMAASGKVALEEIRLRMTLDINVSLLKRGMEIDTIPLTQLVEDMKQEQTRLAGLFLGEGSEEQLQTKINLFEETSKAVKEIPYLPAAVIGRMKLEESYSLSMVHETGTELKARYEAAGQSYETLMTSPRKDMGDTITKAFRNVDDILADLHMEAVEENRKAVRILGYNSMPINKENVERIKEETARVLKIINNLTPAKTLEMIRQGINPLDMKLEMLSAKIDAIDTEERNEKYSAFLYKLERNDKITPKERESYIGIYRFMNRLEKTDGAAIGAMVNQNRDITFRSLISGMRSSKFSLNEKIDDNFGFLDNIVTKGVSITTQIEAAYGKEAGEEYETAQRSYENEKYEEFMGNLKEMTDIVPEDMMSQTIEDTVAYLNLEDSENSPFAKLKKMAEKYDNEIENKLEEVFAEFTDSFEDRDSARFEYDRLCQTVQDYSQTIIDTGADSYIDLKSLMLCNKQLTVMGKLSRQERYTVPIYANGELSTVNLTFKHSEARKGSVDIDFNNTMMGKVTAHLQMSTDSIKGLVVCDSKAGVDNMKKAVNLISQKVESSCEISVVIGKENRTGNVYDYDMNADIDNVDTKSLYKLAKEFIKASMVA